MLYNASYRQWANIPCISVELAKKFLDTSLSIIDQNKFLVFGLNFKRSLYMIFVNTFVYVDVCVYEKKKWSGQVWYENEIEKRSWVELNLEWNWKRLENTKSHGKLLLPSPPQRTAYYRNLLRSKVVKIGVFQDRTFGEHRSCVERWRGCWSVAGRVELIGGEKW